MATGLVATESQTASAPTPAGPSLLGPARDGTSLESATEQTTSLSSGPVTLGVAGCTDARGTPGGTTLRVGAWSIFGGAVHADGLRADLVPGEPLTAPAGTCAPRFEVSSSRAGR